MSRYQQQKPENVLNRAREQKEHGRDEDALSLLQEFLKNKKANKTWTNVYPELYQIFINLCVKLKKSQAAKEGLYQCKTMTQHQHPDQLEIAIKTYISSAKQKVKEAKKVSKEEARNILGDYDDLDCIVTPETLLHSVTSAGDEERSDRKHLTPWVKFLWDCYRQCIEILKNNIKLEKIYKDIAIEACRFCVDYQRNNEFRKLCEMMRLHLRNITENNVNKQNYKREFHVSLVSTSGSCSEQHYASQSHQTEIRLKVLNSSIELKMWQEAFKTIEDIHQIQTFTRRVPKSYANGPKFKSKFLDLSSTVLQKAGQPLLHAATCHRIFNLNKDLKKDISEERLKKLASQTLLATLAIPLIVKQHGIGRMIDMGPQAVEKHLKLAKVFNYERLPTRRQLVQDIQYKRILEHVPDPLKVLFKSLELEFNPLRLAHRVDKHLKWLEDMEQNSMAEFLKPYVAQLQHVTASRVLLQVSEIYETIEFKSILKLVPFYNQFELEQHILDACRSGDLKAKIDQTSGTIMFGSIFDPAPLCVNTNNIISRNNEQSDWINNHFNKIHEALSKASSVIKTDEEYKAQDEQFIQAAKLFKYKDADVVKHYNKRKADMENFKYSLETKLSEKKANDEKKTRNEIIEAKRRQQELEDEISAQKAKTAADKILREDQTRYIENKLKDMMEGEKSRFINHIDTEDCLDLSFDKVVQKQIDGIRKERIETKKFLTKIEEDKDHFERAKRQVERTKRTTTADARLKEQEEAYNKMKEEAFTVSKQNFETNIEFKNKFSHMQEKIDECTTEVEQSAKEQYEFELQSFNDMMTHTIDQKRKVYQTEFKEKKRREFQDRINQMIKMTRDYEEHQKEQERIASNKRLQAQKDAEQKKLDEARKLEQPKERPRFGGLPSRDTLNKPEPKPTGAWRPSRPRMADTMTKDGSFGRRPPMTKEGSYGRSNISKDGSYGRPGRFESKDSSYGRPGLTRDNDRDDNMSDRFRRDPPRDDRFRNRSRDLDAGPRNEGGYRNEMREDSHRDAGRFRDIGGRGLGRPRDDRDDRFGRDPPNRDQEFRRRDDRDDRGGRFGGLRRDDRDRDDRDRPFRRDDRDNFRRDDDRPIRRDDRDDRPPLRRDDRDDRSFRRDDRDGPRDGPFRRDDRDDRSFRRDDRGDRPLRRDVDRDRSKDNFGDLRRRDEPRRDGGRDNYGRRDFGNRDMERAPLRRDDGKGREPIVRRGYNETINRNSDKVPDRSMFGAGKKVEQVENGEVDQDDDGEGWNVVS